MLLKIHREIDGDTLRVALAGEFDGAAVATFRAAVDRGAMPWQRLALDMRDLAFIDSAGLHELVLLHEHATAEGRDVILVRPSPSVSRLLELTGLESHFAVRD
jgi:anti-anti-sigma factor